VDADRGDGERSCLLIKERSGSSARVAGGATPRRGLPSMLARARWGVLRPAPAQAGALIPKAGNTVSTKAWIASKS
jgi:hypothetical protein